MLATLCLCHLRLVPERFKYVLPSPPPLPLETGNMLLISVDSPVVDISGMWPHPARGLPRPGRSPGAFTAAGVSASFFIMGES